MRLQTELPVWGCDHTPRISLFSAFLNRRNNHVPSAVIDPSTPPATLSYSWSNLIRPSEQVPWTQWRIPHYIRSLFSKRCHSGVLWFGLLTVLELKLNRDSIILLLLKSMLPLWLSHRFPSCEHKRSCTLLPPDNFYGTPKPPAEPSPAAPPLNVSEVLLPGARPSAQGKRKRNQSVSNMEQRASLEPPEEEEEESPVVNGNGVAITPGAVKWETNGPFPVTHSPSAFHQLATVTLFAGVFLKAHFLPRAGYCSLADVIQLPWRLLHCLFLLFLSWRIWCLSHYSLISPVQRHPQCSLETLMV